MRRVRKRPEQALQIEVANVLRVVAPGVIWFHVPNGGSRNPVEAAILKAMGVRAGTPDLVFVLPGGVAGFIELKADTGRLSLHQRAFIEQAIGAGCAAAVCTSVAEVLLTLEGWGVPLRGRVAA